MITANYAVAVTPSDGTNDPAGPFDGFICTVAGNATVLADGSTVAVVMALTAGSFYPIRIKRVNLTGLTATVIGLKA